jgi:hypothetical protein
MSKVTINPIAYGEIPFNSQVKNFPKWKEVYGAGENLHRQSRYIQRI